MQLKKISNRLREYWNIYLEKYNTSKNITHLLFIFFASSSGFDLRWRKAGLEKTQWFKTLPLGGYVYPFLVMKYSTPPYPVWFGREMWWFKREWPHKFLFAYVVPSWWNYLRRIRNCGDSVALGVGFGISEVHIIPSNSLSASN